MKRRAASADAIVLLSTVVAAVLLLPLRGVTEAFPLLAYTASLVLFGAPGVLLTCWLFAEDVRGIAVLPVGFVISTGIFGLLGIPAMISHQSMDAYLWWAGATLAVFLAVAAWRTLRSRPAPPTGEKDDPRGPSAGWAWAPFWLLAAALVFVSTRRVPGRNDDIWVYLAWVRDLAGSGQLALQEPYFGDRVADLARVQVNGWLLLKATLVRVSGLDSNELVLRYLAPTLVVVALLAVFALSLSLFEDERIAVLCASVFALFHVALMEPSVHKIGMELVGRIVEDKHVGRFLFLPIALMFATLYVKRRKLRYLFFFAFMCWAVVSAHPVVLAGIGLCMLGFGLVHVAVNLRSRQAWTGMIALAVALWSVGLGPILILFGGGDPLAVLYSSDINAMPPEVINYTVFITPYWRHIYEFADGSYMMHPWLILNPIILGTYVLGIPFLIWRIRDSIAAQLLLGGLVMTTIVVYVPPVATFVGENILGPNLLWRLSWPIPLLALITAGWMLWEALQFVSARLGGRTTLVRVLPVALVVVLAAVAAPVAVARNAQIYGYELPPASYDPDPIYPWLRENIMEPSVMLTLDQSSTAIPAYSANLNVVSYRSEAYIRDREKLEEYAGSKIEIAQRNMDNYDFFHGADLETEGYDILRRHNVDYLMVFAGGSYDERLKTLPGFTAVEGAPKEKYSLYAVDLDKLGRPTDAGG